MSQRISDETAVVTGIVNGSYPDVKSNMLSRKEVHKVRKRFLTGKMKWTREELIKHAAQALNDAPTSDTYKEIAKELGPDSLIRILLITGYISP